MKKKTFKKLNLNRETIRTLDAGLEHAAGGITTRCPDSVSDCVSDCPNCDTSKCLSGS